VYTTILDIKGPFTSKNFLKHGLDWEIKEKEAAGHGLPVIPAL
jgi:hypothetical protein